MKDWLLVYKTEDGVEHRTIIQANSIPKLKAVAWHAIMDAFNQNPPHPLGNLSAERWLEKCGIELVDLALVRKNSLTPLARSGSPQQEH